MAQNSLGTAEAQLDVSVEALHGRPGAPTVTVDPTQVVVAGQTARLRCSATGRAGFVLGLGPGQDRTRRAPPRASSRHSGLDSRPRSWRVLSVPGTGLIFPLQATPPPPSTGPSCGPPCRGSTRWRATPSSSPGPPSRTPGSTSATPPTRPASPRPSSCWTWRVSGRGAAAQAGVGQGVGEACASLPSRPSAGAWCGGCMWGAPVKPLSPQPRPMPPASQTRLRSEQATRCSCSAWPTALRPCATSGPGSTAASPAGPCCARASCTSALPRPVTRAPIAAWSATGWALLRLWPRSRCKVSGGGVEKAGQTGPGLQGQGVWRVCLKAHVCFQRCWGLPHPRSLGLGHRTQPLALECSGGSRDSPSLRWQGTAGAG